MPNLLIVDIVACDAVPPEPPAFYYDHNYTTMHAGTCRDTVDNHNRANYANRAFLRISPNNNPDNRDNAVVFHSPALSPTACRPTWPPVAPRSFSSRQMARTTTRGVVVLP